MAMTETEDQTQAQASALERWDARNQRTSDWLRAHPGAGTEPAWYEPARLGMALLAAALVILVGGPMLGALVLVPLVVLAVAVAWRTNEHARRMAPLPLVTWDG